MRRAARLVLDFRRMTALKLRFPGSSTDDLPLEAGELGIGLRADGAGLGPVATEALLARIDGRASSTGVDRETSLARSAEATALRTLASPQNVADAALFLSSALSGATTGHLLPVDGGVL